MDVESKAWDGPFSRAAVHAERAERILRDTLHELNHVAPHAQTIRHPILLLHPTSDYDDNDSGYMSNDNNDTTDQSTPTATTATTTAPTVDTAAANGERALNDTPATPLSRRPSNADAQAQVIASLREQVQDLFSQVTELNNKLVKSYDRVSDLEDDLHISASNLRSSSLTISNLELERSQHLSALNTGLLVEKDQVTAELTRLMEKATEEAAQRGQAESARAEIEKDLDDLSAGLFNQANTMVAEARFGRAVSERKAEDAERALRETEEVVRLMQLQMQELQEEKETSEKKVAEMSMTMGKGKWIARTPSPSHGRISPRLLSSHLPYQEFLMFVAHLRTLRPNSTQVPAMSTLLPLPFLSRLATEDTEPTVRLDLAPSLNWLTRRSVLSAIHSGQLSIEPISATALLECTIASQNSLPVPTNSNPGICCALCGTSLTDGSSPVRNHSSNNSWGSSIFKDALSRSLSNQKSSPPSSPPPQQNSFSNTNPSNLPSQIYIFKLVTTTTTLPQSPNAKNQTTVYPLCSSGWCLTRLRTTCSLWAFVRTGIVEKVWEEEVPSLPPPLPRKDSSDGRPSIPPRRKSKMGGLWGMASALGMDRGLSWGEGNSRSGSPSNEKSEKSAMGSPKVPPPTHPTHSPSIAKRFVAPIATSAAATPPPPPLPTRNRSRTIVQHNVVPAPAGEISEESSMYSKASEEEQRIGEVMRLRGGAASSESLPEPETETEEGELRPSTSNETNQDAFHTPTDEPAEFSVPSSPTPVAAAPAPAPTPAPAPAARASVSPRTSMDAPTARSASPATPSSKRNSVTGAPSRTGSPAPPPVPRRAAARNRPVPPPPPSGPRPRSATESSPISEPVSLPPVEPTQPPAPATVAEETSASAPAPVPEEPATESASAPAPAAEANPDTDAAEASVPPPPPTSAGEPIVEEPAPAMHIPPSDSQEVKDEVEKPAQPSVPTHPPAEANEPATEPAPAAGAEAAEVASVVEELRDTKHHRDESQELVFTAGSDYDSEPPHSAPLHPPTIPAPHSMLETSTTAEELMREAEAGEHEEEEHDSFAPLPVVPPVTAPAPTATATPPLPARSRGRSGSIMQPPPPPKFASRRVAPINGVGGGVNGVSPLAVASVKEKIEPVVEEESEKENISVDVNGGEQGEKVQGVGVDGEIYVGEATWEERTWKQLVRLREEMFWARIGGVR